jgi:hypothetical protein
MCSSTCLEYKCILNPAISPQEADVSANLAQVAAVLWVLVMLLAGAVVVNTLYARTLFWDHVDHLAGKGGMKKRLSNDFGVRRCYC